MSGVKTSYLLRTNRTRFEEVCLLFAANVVFLSNIGPVRLGPCAGDFEILRMWDIPGLRLDIGTRDHFVLIPQKSFEYSPGIKIRLLRCHS